MDERTKALDDLDRRVRSFLGGLAGGGAAGRLERELARLETRDRDRFGGAVARIAAHDADPAMRHIALSFIMASQSAPIVSRRTREAFARSARPVLLDAFLGDAIDDDQRWLIGPMMELCGVRLPSEQYAAAFDDFEGAHRRMVRVAMDRLEKEAPDP
jgi:hypothetical protein